MRAETAVISAWADNISKYISKKVIEELQGISGYGGLSLDSFNPENIWDEICVLVKIYEDNDLDSYSEIIDAFLEHHIENLSQEEKLALWLTTNAGLIWISNHHSDKCGAKKAPVMVNKLVLKVKDSLLKEAIVRDGLRGLGRQRQ